MLVPAGEVTPLVLMEAMAHRTPAVAARMGSIPDVIVDGETGLLFEPDDPDGAARAIESLAADPASATASPPRAGTGSSRSSIRRSHTAGSPTRSRVSSARGRSAGIVPKVA